jgi:hypothetical protein
MASVMTTQSSNLSIDNAKAKGNVSLGRVLLHLLFDLLVETHAAITDQNVIDLLKIKVYMIMMMSVVSSSSSFLLISFLHLLFNLMTNVSSFAMSIIFFCMYHMVLRLLIE